MAKLVSYYVFESRRWMRRLNPLNFDKRSKYRLVFLLRMLFAAEFRILFQTNRLSFDILMFFCWCCAIFQWRKLKYTNCRKFMLIKIRDEIFDTINEKYPQYNWSICFFICGTVDNLHESFLESKKKSVLITENKSEFI